MTEATPGSENFGEQSPLSQDYLQSMGSHGIIDPTLRANDFERQLVAEGMPAELPKHQVLPQELYDTYTHIAAVLLREKDRLPTFKEIAKGGKFSKVEERAVSLFGIQEQLPDDDYHAGPTEWIVEDPTEALSLRDTLETVLNNALDDDRRSIIIGRFNLNDEGVKTLGELSGIFRVSESKMRRLESEALKKLRIPLKVALRGEHPAQQIGLTLQILRKSMPKIPPCDPENQRPYTIRLREALEIKADIWFKKRMRELYIHTAYLDSENRKTLEPIAMQVKPASVRTYKSQQIAAYEVNTLCIASLNELLQTITDEQEQLVALNKYLSSISRHTYSTELLALNIRMQRYRRYGAEIWSRILRYRRQAATAKPRYIHFTIHDNPNEG